MSHAEALQHCFVNTTHYGNHIANRAQSLMSVSDRHKLIYRNNPKASSSSARHAMIDFLEGGDVRMKHDNMEDKVHKRGYSMISFIRAPLSRFYSSYDEAFFRMGPWMATEKNWMGAIFMLLSSLCVSVKRDAFPRMNAFFMVHG